jgi:hypothetical protein
MNDEECNLNVDPSREKRNLKVIFLGFSFCNGLQLNISFYIAGSISWGSLTAFHRVLYIQANNWVKHKVGEFRFLYCVMILGVVFTAVFGFFLAFSDDESLTLKICNHHAEEFLAVSHSYKVP